MGGLYVLLSIFSDIGSFFFGFLSLGHAFSHNGSYSSVLLFLILSLFSVVGSVILAIKANKQGVNWGMSMLAVGMAVLVYYFYSPISLFDKSLFRTFLDYSLIQVIFFK